MPDLPLPELADVLELLPPAGAALVLFLVGVWLSRRGSPGLFAVVSVIAIWIAYSWTFVRLRGPPALPPIQSTERGFYGILAVGALALIPATSRLAFQRRGGLQIIAGFAAALPIAGGIFSKVIAPWPVAAVVVGAVALVLLLDQVSFRQSSLFCFSLAVAFGASGEVFLMFGGAVLAQLAGAVAIAMALLGIASAVFREPLPAVVAMPLAAIIVACSFDAALFMYQPPPTFALVLFAASPLAPLLIRRPVSFGGLSKAARAGFGFALSLVVAGLGFFLAWRVAPEPYG